MNRRLVACTSPAALLAGMLLLHCSSSSSPSTTPDSGTTKDSSTTTHHDTGTEKADTGSKKMDAGGGKGDSGGGSKDSGSKDAGAPPFIFNPDAACVAIEGGAPCDPGDVQCSGAMCTVPGHECCLGGAADASDVCLATDAACSGIPEACNETRDCASGQLCCLSVYSIDPTVAQTECQTYGAMRVCDDPKMPLVQAQICKSDDECASNACVRYSCMGTTIVSCSNPYAGLCTPITDGGM